MRAQLLHRDRDFDPKQALPWNEAALMQDLELGTLLQAMAGEDRFLHDVAHEVMLSGSGNDIGTILYRQEILKDCLMNPAVTRELYRITFEAIESRKKQFWGFLSTHPAGILSSSVGLLEMHAGYLKMLKDIAAAQKGRFRSEGFTVLFAMLERELDDDYLESIQAHLKELRFTRGLLMSAGLGPGNSGDNYVLRKANRDDRSLLEQFFSRKPDAYTFQIDERDSAGAEALARLRERGINLVANAVAQSAEHIQGFFEMLRIELAFYVACLNLHDQLASRGQPVAFPVPLPASDRRLSMHNLYDVSLVLNTAQPVVGNDADCEGKSLVIVTGANQGGKSSFLRSIGLAQLMMQCGMFVGAQSFTAGLCNGLFTHYKREEDKTLESGKLDEELARMSDIADHLQADSLLLFNESFAVTNEREGSEIARQIVHALLEKRIRVFFVTHMYDFARSFLDRRSADTMFLHAGRETDGSRTFRLVEGEPLATSYGEDLYRKIFAGDAAEEN